MNEKLYNLYLRNHPTLQQWNELDVANMDSSDISFTSKLKKIDKYGAKDKAWLILEDTGELTIDDIEDNEIIGGESDNEEILLSPISGASTAEQQLYDFINMANDYDIYGESESSEDKLSEDELSESNISNEPEDTITSSIEIQPQRNEFDKYITDYSTNELNIFDYVEYR